MPLVPPPLHLHLLLYYLYIGAMATRARWWLGSSANREQAWASQRPRVVAAGADEAVADGQAVPTAVATLRCSRALVYSLISSDLCLSWAAIFPCRGGFCQRLFLDAVTLH